MRQKLFNETARAAAAALLGGLAWTYLGFALLYGTLQQPLV